MQWRKRLEKNGVIVTVLCTSTESLMSPGLRRKECASCAVQEFVVVRFLLLDALIGSGKIKDIIIHENVSG